MGMASQAQASCDFSPLLSGYQAQDRQSSAPGSGEAQKFVSDYFPGPLSRDEFYGNTSMPSGEWNTRGSAHVFSRGTDRQWLVKMPFRNVQYLYEFDRCGLKSVLRRSRERGEELEDYRVTPEFCQILAQGGYQSPRGAGTFADVEEFRRTGTGYDLVKKLIQRVNQTGARLPYSRLANNEIPRDSDYGFSRMKKFCAEVQLDFKRWTIPPEKKSQKDISSAHIQAEPGPVTRSEPDCATCGSRAAVEPEVSKPLKQVAQVASKPRARVERPVVIAESTKPHQSAPAAKPKPAAPVVPKDPRVSALRALENYKKTGKCPTTSQDLLVQKPQLETWVNLYANAPQDLEPIRGNYEQRYQFCGYNFSRKTWTSELTFRLDWRNRLLQTLDGHRDCLEYEVSRNYREQNVFVVKEGCRGERSHREKGEYSDLVLVQVSPGVYLGLFYMGQSLIGAGYLFTQTGRP